MTIETTTDAAETSLASLIAGNPGLAADFEGLGLDFCCHADRTLAEACAAAGVPLAKALEVATRTRSDDIRTHDVDWPRLSLVGLVDHIEDLHHRYLHMELPSLIGLSSKVLSVHGERHPELERVAELVSMLRDDFIPHLAKEERVLFPAIRELASGHIGFAFGSVSNPISVMMSEHESVGGILRELREVSSGYEVPDDGCRSYQRLYERLAAVESDTHMHVMKENSFLFPRAVEFEAALATR